MDALANIPGHSAAPSIEAFTSTSYRHETVCREDYGQGEHRRFHILFSYPNGSGGVASGDQVVMARDLGQAAVRVAEERGVAQLLVRKRFFYGRPASDAEVINRVFDIVEAAAPQGAAA